MTEQSKLAPLEPTTRQDIEAVHELTSAIMQELSDLPHVKWVRVNRLADELLSTFDEKLPGGFADQCDGCNTPLGHDDNYSTSEDVTICADCAARYEAERAGSNVSYLNTTKEPA
ncbi:MAG: hypothetical protein CML24_11575 [Rhizobiales bacterium]|nr:hypothetical protein [Hyphomicrobiales bacterium]|tara:strand:- start:18258 stop:18602 length:345 start_codon:yes stop_codon:yes gene_type:complete